MLDISILEASKLYLDSGLSVTPFHFERLPHKVKKVPDGNWRAYQKCAMTEEEARDAFQDAEGIGIICGYGNIVCLDFDYEVARIFPDFQSRVESAYPELWAKLVVTNSLKGKHLYYRTPNDPGKTEYIAQDEQDNNLVEYRAHGGFTADYPSPGYTKVQGSLTDIPTITQEEATFLKSLAASFDKRNEQSRKRTQRHPYEDGRFENDRTNPGGDFNMAVKENPTLLTNLLEEEGYVYLGDDIDGQRWERPNYDGNNDSTARLYLNEDSATDFPVFYNFSSNDPHFAKDTAYDPFGVYARLKHGGVTKKAASDLRAQGYGKPKAQEHKAQTKKVTAHLLEDFLTLELPAKESLIDGLLSQRDLVALAGRRRHGKTTFVFNLAMALSGGKPNFLNFSIPKPRKVVAFLLEDDTGELQIKARTINQSLKFDQRLRIITRDDFLDQGIRIDIKDPTFRQSCWGICEQHKPDAIIIDNLSNIVSGDYNNSETMHALAQYCRAMARAFNAAVIVPCHPRKQSTDNNAKTLKDDPDGYFDTIMGSSHFANSFGSLWAIERDLDTDDVNFLGGQQRLTGEHSIHPLTLNKSSWFEVVSDSKLHFNLVINTLKRQRVWDALPGMGFTYTQIEKELPAQGLISVAGLHKFWKSLVAHNLVTGNGNKWVKVPC